MRAAVESSRRRPGAVQSSPNPGISSLRTGTSYASGGHYSQMFSLVVGIGDAAAAVALPNVKALLYCSGVQVEHNVADRNIGAFVDITQARNNGWLLHKGGSGSTHELYYSGGTTSLADPGNAAFQNEWVNECLAVLAQYGLDGIHVDNFEIDLLNFGAAVGGVTGFTYPTDEADGASQSAWADAQISFAQNALKRIRDAGYYVVVNGNAFISGNNASNDGTLTKTWIDRYYPFVSAMEIEYWETFDDGAVNIRSSGPSDPYPFWSEWLSIVPYCQARGIGFHGLVYGSSSQVQRCRYARGSFLMEWDGALGTFAWAPLADVENWNSAMDYVTGSPLSPKVQLATGVWKRAYTNYTVYVNSTLSSGTWDGQTIPAQDALFVPVSGGGTTGTWGSTTTSGTDYAGYTANMEALTKVIATPNIVSKHTVWIKNQSGATINVKAVARVDNAVNPGQPDAWLATGTAVAVANGTDALVDLPISYTPASGDLWIGLIADGNFLIKRTALSGGLVAYATDTYSDGPATSWGSQASGNLGVDSFVNTMYATHS